MATGNAQGDRQASVRALTGTALSYEGDWLALFDQAGISAEGGYNGRLLAWINAQLSATYTNVNDAMAAFAVAQGATNWSGLGTFVAGPPGNVAYFDFTKGIYSGPALSVSRSSVKWIDDSAGVWSQALADALARSNKGALLEGAQTNGIRNNSGQGAVAGTPGTDPTNWTVFLPTGLSKQIVSTFTENGIDFVRLRYFGTISGTSSQVSALEMETTTGIAATAGQVWTPSAFLRVPAGSTAGVSSLTLSMNCLASDGSTSTGAINGSNIVASLGSAVARFSTGALTTPASTAFVRPRLRFVWGSVGTAVDLTLDVGWPQHESWASSVTTVGGASSPLRTAGAAGTRAADAVTSSLSGAVSTATLAAVFRPAVPTLGGTIARIGTASDGLLLRYGASDATKLEAVAFVGGVAQASALTSSSALTAGTRYAAAASFTSGRIALSLNGAAVIAASPASMPSGLTALAVGSGTNAANAYAEKLAIWPSALTDTQLQTYATLATWGG